MPEPILTTIVAALVSGAAAGAGQAAAQAIIDSYNSLRSLLVQKLGNKQAEVIGIEEDPTDRGAQERLIKRLAEKGLHHDSELRKQAEQVERAVTEAKVAGLPGTGNISIEDIRTKLDARINDLIASGDITIRNIDAGGGVDISGLRAGAGVAQTSEERKKN